MRENALLTTSTTRLENWSGSLCGEAVMRASNTKVVSASIVWCIHVCIFPHDVRSRFSRAGKIRVSIRSH